VPFRRAQPRTHKGDAKAKKAAQINSAGHSLVVINEVIYVVAWGRQKRYRLAWIHAAERRSDGSPAFQGLGRIVRNYPRRVATLEPLQVVTPTNAEPDSSLLLRIAC
jgi:hypothetical protein